MKAANSEVETGETPIVNSRYSIVIAAAKRARQIIDGAEPLIARLLSIAFLPDIQSLQFTPYVNVNNYKH